MSAVPRASAKIAFAIFLPVLGCASFAFAAAPLEKYQPPRAPSKSERFEKQLALGTLDTVFFFDHFFTKRSTIVSPGYLNRLAHISGPLHDRYLAYTQQKLSRHDLVSALPHIAMLGDSLTKNLYVSPSLSLLWRARTAQQRNWFLDTDPSPNSINSLYERLNKVMPVVVSDFARGAAEVTAHPGDEVVAKTLARTRNLTGQVDQVLLAQRFPDLLLIWIGHNNLNWVKGLPMSLRKRPEPHLRELAQNFHEDYARELGRLIERAKKQDHKISIVIFGLADCRSFFQARNKAGALHAEDPRAYPYFDICIQRYESLKPEYQSNMVVMRDRLNRELRAIVADINRELRGSPNLRLEYSDSFASIDLGQVEYLHRLDGQHLSVKGHNLVAERAIRAIQPSLTFLGVAPHMYAAGSTEKTGSRP